MSALRRWSAKGRPYNVEIELDIETDTMWGQYSFTLGSERRGEYRVKKEKCLVGTPGETKVETWFETSNGKWVGRSEELNVPIQRTGLTFPLTAGIEPYNALYNFLTGMSFYNIFPNALGEPQRPANPYPLDEHGGNLASVLRELERNKSAFLPNLEAALGDVIDDVNSYQVSQVGGYLVTKLRHDTSDGNRAPLFELFQESDGTLRMLGILTALYQDPPRTLIALEEPELTIHPGAMSMLWEEIQNASSRSQILVTTHSPDLLDMCEAEQLRVVEKLDGITHIGPIEVEQKQIVQDRLFAPGQLLQAQGLRRAQENQG
jgi:predicted ATPase